MNGMRQKISKRFADVADDVASAFAPATPNYLALAA